jgi:hypothetical protein
VNNFKIDLTAEGDAVLIQAMQIAFSNAPGRKAEAFMVSPEKGLVFFWAPNLSSNKDIVKLPFKLDAEGAADFARRWLAEQDYGRDPGHDGDNGKGFRIYCESWGRIADLSGSFVAIQPEWAWYGK